MPKRKCLTIVNRIYKNLQKLEVEYEIFMIYIIFKRIKKSQNSY